ncbi:MAG TPA: glutaredoxin domain-containing protein [Galbitalea sp.]|jgi:glutaredoxin
MTSSTAESFDTVTMFGASWCSDCRRSKALLDSLGVAYDYVDVEASKEDADRAQAISGRINIPVIVFPDSAVQVEPSDAELKAKLESIGALAVGP